MDALLAVTYQDLCSVLQPRRALTLRCLFAVGQSENVLARQQYYLRPGASLRSACQAYHAKYYFSVSPCQVTFLNFGNILPTKYSSSTLIEMRHLWGHPLPQG